jgi:hypothetical protein
MRDLRALFVCWFFAVTLGISALAQTSNQSDQPQPSGSSATAQASSQPDQAQHPGTSEGTVESVGRQTMLVRTEDNQSHLFIFDNPTVRPKGLTAGTRVRIISHPTDEAGVQRATRVTILDAGATPQSGIAQDTAPPPKELTSVQRDIERQARRWALGFRMGAGLDPELFLIGVHAGIGPIFSRDFYFRPNVEFAFGELTDMFALNLEGVYRLPITFREGRWSAYVGAGPGLNFIHEGVGTRDISFSNFNYETGFNMFTGIRFRRGTFGEVKTSLWAGGVPTLRFIFGYTF